MIFFKKTKENQFYTNKLNLTELANKFETDKGNADKTKLSWGNYWPEHICWGYTEIYEKYMSSFLEKPVGDGRWISGGFFVCEPEVLDLIDGDDAVWEREPLESLAAAEQLSAYQHMGFWQPMDTLREKNLLEELWASGKAPWKVW